MANQPRQLVVMLSIDATELEATTIAIAIGLLRGVRSVTGAPNAPATVPRNQRYPGYAPKLSPK